MAKVGSGKISGKEVDRVGRLRLMKDLRVGSDSGKQWEYQREPRENWGKVDCRFRKGGVEQAWSGVSSAARFRQSLRRSTGPQGCAADWGGTSEARVGSSTVGIGGRWTGTEGQQFVLVRVFIR